MRLNGGAFAYCDKDYNGKTNQASFNKVDSLKFKSRDIGNI